MLDHAREALEHAGKRSKQELEKDRVRYLAIVHLVEIVGEAAGRLTPEEQSQYPGIPWREIVGTRNRLVHGYDQVDSEQLWMILKTDLPDLICRLEEHLR